MADNNGVTQRTFIMVKPDGVARGLVGDIIGRFERRGYKLVAMKQMIAGEDLLMEHYGHLKDLPFFPGLIKFIGSGPVVPMVWEGNDVVRQGRAMLGETDPLVSPPGTIRGDFGLQVGRNIVHGSDSPETASREIALWFNAEDLNEWSLPTVGSLYE